jgi:hypothetical protein
MVHASIFYYLHGVMSSYSKFVNVHIRIAHSSFEFEVTQNNLATA